MALYQSSVLKKYLKQQDADAVHKAYKKYVKYFQNPTIQENIRNSKEEEYQGIFLTELFVNVLGYTLKPQANFNLVAEYKNQNNARKADGAILDNDTAIGVIELKGTNTKDLESIRKQAFDYKANQKGCVYVITSNFEKLRFYINDATEFEEFNLFELSEDQFQLLYLCLHKDNVLTNLPLSIKESSIVEEEKITKSFYNDYSVFKRELYRDLVKQNGTRLKAEARERLKEVATDEAITAELERIEKNTKLSLFKKSQKLIDRFLFIFFAEDRGLLPPNSTVQILNKWQADIDFGDERPLYNLFKQYFNFLDQGRKGTSSRAEIYAYNGGLFKPDPILDSLLIDNELLHKYTLKLANYDFESQVDVNILGHIFENSLNEIESINAEIEGGDFDKQKSKRKKDGVFYTPKYITKYIVENTVGKLCDEKKAALGFKEEEYFKGRKNRNKATVTKLIAILDEYRAWLLQLTICDPACGSGAFLNQALDFLIKEHTYIDELKAKILGGGIVFSDIENTILENNIYGVDLNEESVEIAKLSLWLRTAQPRRKLNDLSSNIKCGNSLIDNKTVAGDKAFNWEDQFPNVFNNGGFDIVIGNPPYGALVSKKEKAFYKKHYAVTEYNYDTYNFFFEKSIEVLKVNSYLGFITPNTFLVVENGKKLREFLFRENMLVELFEVFNVFPDAVVEPINILIKKSSSRNDHKFDVLLENRHTKEVTTNTFEHKNIFQNDKLIFNYRESKTEGDFYRKIKQFSLPLSSYAKVTTGIKPYQRGKGRPKQDALVLKEKPFTNFIGGEGWYPLVRGTQINKYLTKWDGEYIKYGEWLAEPRKPEIFFKEKLLIRRTDDNLMCTYDDDDLIGINSVHVIQSFDSKMPNKYLLGIINSKLTNWFFRHENFHMVNKPMAEVKVVFVERLPVILSNNYSNVIEKVDFILDLSSALMGFSLKFTNFINSNFKGLVFSKRLQKWHELDYGDFIKELNKAIKANNKILLSEGKEATPTLTKKDEFEWLDLFEDNKKKAQDLQQQINQTEREIDAMVYEMYGLTEEEIAIVENS